MNKKAAARRRRQGHCPKETLEKTQTDDSDSDSPERSEVSKAHEANFAIFGPVTKNNGFSRQLKADRIICGFPRHGKLLFLVQFGDAEEVVTQLTLKNKAPQLLIDFYIANLHPRPLDNSKPVVESPPEEAAPPSAQPTRRAYSMYQVSELEREFQSDMYLKPEKCQYLAEKLQLTERQVKSWFANRRTKARRFGQDELEKTERKAYKKVGK